MMGKRRLLVPAPCPFLALATAIGLGGEGVPRTGMDGWMDGDETCVL